MSSLLLGDVALLGGTSKPVAANDPDPATPGWTALDQFNLSAGEVTVTLTPSELPCILMADAIRWMPAEYQEE